MEPAILIVIVIVVVLVVILIGIYNGLVQRATCGSTRRSPRSKSS